MAKKRTAEPSGKSNHQLHDKGYKKLFSNKDMFLEFLQTFVKEDWVKDINEEAQKKDYKLPAIIPIVLYNGSQQWDAVIKYQEQ